MKQQFDERQVATKRRIATQTLIITQLAILVDGAVNQWHGSWAPPLSQALLIVWVTGLIGIVQMVWNGAYFTRFNDPRLYLAGFVIGAVGAWINFAAQARDHGPLSVSAVFAFGPSLMFTATVVTSALRWLVDRRSAGAVS